MFGLFLKAADMLTSPLHCDFTRAIELHNSLSLCCKFLTTQLNLVIFLQNYIIKTSITVLISYAFFLILFLNAYS